MFIGLPGNIGPNKAGINRKAFIANQAFVNTPWNRGSKEESSYLKANKGIA